MGRQTTITWGAEPATATIVYDNLGKVLSESHSGGPLAGFSITNGYDSFLRRTNVALLDAYSVIQAETTNSFDALGRLSTVGNGPAKATYSYLANSPLVEQISFANNGTAAMTTQRTYDYLNRLTSIQSLNPQFSTLNSFAYDYNSANQRSVRREADGAYWRFGYDALGQVKDGKKYWPDGSPVPGQQFEYAFDDIGNRTRTRSGGDQYGGALRSADYGPNLLNQYTNRVIPAAFDVLGVANGTNNVTVNGSPADCRRGEYFQEVVNVANSSAAVWQGVAVTNTQTGAFETGHVFVPRTPEVFRHDLDGNLTNDGRWKFVWDPENRLVRMVADSDVGPQHWITFQYDWRGRRVAKSIGPIGSEEATNTVKFIYDDWNLIGVLDSESSLLQSFSWGTDLSGSMQGAGGVGGLIFVSTSSSGMHFPSFDGNGNVMALIGTQDSSPSAQYEYGPFGETIRTTGPMATANPFRFSTKYQDDETGLLYYGYRYYGASTGKWLSRDPISEQGGLNLCALVKNDPIAAFDYLGLIKPGVNDPYSPLREGQPCSCMCERRPCRIEVGLPLLDNGSKPGMFRMKAIDFRRQGCCPGWQLRWTSCIRADSGKGGAIPSCNDSTSCNFDPGYGPNIEGGAWMIGLWARYLSCENGRWKKYEIMLGGIYCHTGVNGKKWICD